MADERARQVEARQAQARHAEQLQRAQEATAAVAAEIARVQVPGRRTSTSLRLIPHLTPVYLVRPPRPMCAQAEIDAEGARRRTLEASLRVELAALARARQTRQDVRPAAPALASPWPHTQHGRSARPSVDGMTHPRRVAWCGWFFFIHHY